ncbi:MAG: bacteriohemerythrin [Sedimenticola sp.]
MSKKIIALLWALVICMLIVAIGLSFLFGFDNPIPWVLMAVVFLIPIVYKKVLKKDAVAWKASYSVGIASLDNDHKELIELLNHFQTAHDYNTGEEFERAALDRLVAYTKNHFHDEEALMEKYGYPHLDAHKEQHQEMVQSVEKFIRDYEQRGHEALEGVSHYLRGWLIYHINGTDKEYGTFLNEKGVY